MTPGSSSSTGDSPLSVNTAGGGRILQLSSSAASSAVLDLVVSSSPSARSPVAPVKSRRTPSTAGDGMMMMVLSGSRHLPPGPDHNHARPDSMGTDGAGAGQRLSSDDGGSANPLKRRSTDATVDYPRRRATIACEVCRSRKSRCDGTRPKCKLCAELGADCVYREPGVKLDAGDKLILERLSRIESLLQMSMAATSHNDHGGGSSSNDMNNHNHNSSININSNSDNNNDDNNNNGNNNIHNASSSPSISSGTVNGEGLAAAVATLAAAHAAAPSHMAAAAVIPSGGIGGLGTWASGPAGTNISTMPKVHTNAALHLLRWPGIRDLVALPYDPQILLQLEMAREPLHSLTKTPCVDLTNTEAYCIAYFDRVNVWYACVNPYSWGSHYRIALSNGFREGPESCIVLLVLALGQASLRGSISRIVPHEDPPGLQYFTAAWALLPGMMTSNSVLAAQCHLLAAAYLFYLVRPLEAWNLLCTTSTKLQLLLMSPSARIPAAQRELTERIYWNALLFESDLLAELDLPHSGVVQFEENVGLPGGFEPEIDDDPAQEQEQQPEQQQQQEQQEQQQRQRRQQHRQQQQQQDRPAVGRDDLWYFLAEIALRRLLNRVSQLIYSKDSVVSAASLEPVVSELDFQLMQWYENLPLPLQFPSTRQPLRDPVQTVLRLRFHACRTIIYRPYILAVLDNEQAALDAVVRESCHRCLESAIRQLEHITSHHCGHMPYLWQGALSIVSQTLLVMGATLSPSLLAILLSIVPHQETLDQIFNSVVIEIGRYAVLAPSLRLAAEIVRDAEVRRRAFLNR